MLTYEEITKSEAIKTYIIRADESLGALGFTEHSFAHVMHVAEPLAIFWKPWAMMSAQWNWLRLPVICTILAT